MERRVDSEHEVLEQTAERADFTWAEVGVTAEALRLGTKELVAVMREDVQLARLVSLLSFS